ncbi:MAG: histidine kinase, partial [Saprospiraceae bacterium]
EFMGKSLFDTTSKLIYMLTNHAIVYFNPKDIKRKTSLQNLYLQKIQINGKDSSIDFSNPLHLSYNQNYINLEFAIVDFKNQRKTDFFYSLHGLDEGWREAGKNRNASYSNLAPGNYVFKLKSTIGIEDISGEMNALSFIIHPPFWQSWWFRIVVLFLFVGSIYWIVVLRVKAIRKQEEQKTTFNNQLAEVEMKALRTQMNPHFIFNCLNSINKLILENDTDNASRYLSKFSRLIRMILENSEQRTISLYNEVEMLSAYLEMEAYRFKTKFDYVIDVPEQINRNDIEIPSMLIQPYVENAIWHGLLPKTEKGELKILFNYHADREGNYLSCTIRDNGIGRAKAKELKGNKIHNQKSMGMKVTEERMHLLSVASNKKPEVNITDLFEDGIGSGTQVDLLIPL